MENQPVKGEWWLRLDKRVESYLLPLLLTVLFFLPHVLFLNNGYVDLEKDTVRAGSEIANHGFHADLSSYFSRVDNPIFSLLPLAGAYKIFGESPLVSRLTMMVIAYIFVILLYYYLRNNKGASFAFIVTLLLLSNPMFIIYSQYVYSDVPFTVFLSAALLLLVFSTSLKENIGSSIMLGISFATKYIAAPFFLIAFVFSTIKLEIIGPLWKSKLVSFLRFNIWYFALALLLSVPVIMAVFHFQTSIFSIESGSLVTPGVNLYIPRLFSYLLWLGLFIGPFCILNLYDLWHKAGWKIFLVLVGGAVALTSLVSYFYPISSLHIQAGVFGEMNLGWVESRVPSPVLSAAFFFVLLIAELFTAGLIYDLKRTKEEKENKILEIFLWIILPILIFSLTRVANRYTLSILTPLSLYMAISSFRIYSQHKSRVVPVVLSLYIIVFLAVGFYSNYYLHMRGLP